MKKSTNLSQVGNSIISNPSQKSFRSKMTIISEKNNDNIKNNTPSRIQSSFNKSKESKTERSMYDFSKLQYKDGAILKDAVNSNPGYGLWAITLDKEKENESLNDKNNDKKNNLDVDKIDKKLIEELKFKCDDLEKKIAVTLNQIDEKNLITSSDEKMIKEYEILVSENTRETMLINYEKNILENQAKSLRSALRNATNEIEQLNREIRNNDENCKFLYYDFNKKMEEEDNEEKYYKKLILDKEKQLNIMTKKNEMDKLNKSVNQSQNKKNNQRETLKDMFEKSSVFGENQKMKMEVSALNDIILDLQIEIANLKGRLNKMEEDENKMKDIIVYKDRKANLLQQNINDLNNEVKLIHSQSQINKKIILKKQNELDRLKLIREDINVKKPQEINNNNEIDHNEFV